MSYRKPVQPRAIETERRFLNSARKLFKERGAVGTTIDEIAQDALLHRGAFLKRFGSKDGLKSELYKEYFHYANERLENYRNRLRQTDFATLNEALYYASVQIEKTQVLFFPVTRIMYEDFTIDLQEKRAARTLYYKTVQLINETDLFFHPRQKRNKHGTRACAQLLITLNFEYVIEALYGFPRDAQLRHRMISAAACILLNRVGLCSK